MKEGQNRRILHRPILLKMRGLPRASESPAKGTKTLNQRAVLKNPHKQSVLPQALLDSTNVILNCTTLSNDQ